MIALDPSERPTFDEILHNSRDTLFPDCFYSTFHDFISSVNDISASSPFSNVVDTSLKVPGQIGPQARTDEDRTSIAEAVQADTPHLPTDSDQRISRIWSDFDISAMLRATLTLSLVAEWDYATCNSLVRRLLL